MPTVRECDDCPWAYSNGYTEEWGCLLFGRECEKCKKFDMDVGGCFYSQKKLERLAYEYKIGCRHAQKIAEGYSPYFKKPKTEKTPVNVAGRGFMYKPLDFCSAYEWNYVPNRKGGHRHNHIYNACHRIVFRGKGARRVDRDDKIRFVATFYTSIMLNKNSLTDILKKKWRKNGR